MSKAEEDFVTGSDKMLRGLQGMHPAWERAEFVKLPDGHSRFFVTPPYHPDVDPDGPKAIPRNSKAERERIAAFVEGLSEEDDMGSFYAEFDEAKAIIAAKIRAMDEIS